MKTKLIQRIPVLMLPAALVIVAMMAFRVNKTSDNPQGVVAYTKSVTNITTMTATCNYRVTVLDLGKVKGHGVCVSSRELPVITNMNFPSAAPIQRAADYMVKITGLKPLSTMYARSYVKVDTGVVYGNVVRFVTLRPEK
ncbi:MAG TPA: hypothetical protein VFV31_09755 [Chitinophagaceae bacterium]|nr:hypothetical protein [Chitinophagaceae bacterium]